jgi:hypothetical protein
MSGVAVMPRATAVVHSDREVLGGTPVFQGTRVPFRNLIDYPDGVSVTVIVGSDVAGRRNEAPHDRLRRSQQA